MVKTFYAKDNMDLEIVTEYKIPIYKLSYFFDTHGSVYRRLLSRNTNKIQLCNRIYYSKVFLKAQHVSSGTPLIIRSSKLYLQPLVYMPI